MAGSVYQVVPLFKALRYFVFWDNGTVHLHRTSVYEMELMLNNWRCPEHIQISTMNDGSEPQRDDVIHLREKTRWQYIHLTSLFVSKLSFFSHAFVLHSKCYVLSLELGKYMIHLLGIRQHTGVYQCGHRVLFLGRGGLVVYGVAIWCAELRPLAPRVRWPMVRIVPILIPGLSSTCSLVS